MTLEEIAGPGARNATSKEATSRDAEEEKGRNKKSSAFAESLTWAQEHLNDERTKEFGWREPIY